MKKFIKINLIILVIFCLFSNYICLNYSIATQNNNDDTSGNDLKDLFEIADEDESEEESDEEKDMDTLQLEKSELENQIKESNNQIQLMEDELSSTVVEIAEINQKICDKQMEIETLQAEEGQILSYIEAAEVELESSTERYEKQKDLLEKRLVAMYEMGETSYLDLLLNSKNIAEFLSNYYFIEEITEADNELLDTVEAEKTYNKKIKEALDTKKLILEANRETIEKNTISLTNMNIIKNNRIKELSESELELQQQIEQYQNEISDIETQIRVLALANIGEQYVGGEMAWPVPGYTRISSQYGMRTHPITGVYKLHTGVDISAPLGVNFIAANDGVVTYAGWNNAYGNMVMIDHGGGIVTLYAHGSEILVNVGDTVYQGTPVLKVGSTGYSTGPHAHFEVRVNGEYVQPLDYITSYSSSTSNTDESTQNEISNTITVELGTSKNETDSEELEDTEE